MSKLLAMAVPILKGKEDEFQKFMSELHGRWHNDFIEARKRMNIYERTFHQKTPDGELIVVTLEGENPEQALTEFAKGNDDFTRWFVQSVMNLHGIDLHNMSQFPVPELVIESKQMDKVIV